MPCTRSSFVTPREAKEWHKKSQYHKQRINIYFCQECGRYHISLSVLPAQQEIVNMIRYQKELKTLGHSIYLVEKVSKDQGKWIVAHNGKAFLVLYNKETKKAVILREIVKGDIHYRYAKKLRQPETEPIVDVAPDERRVRTVQASAESEED